MAKRWHINSPDLGLVQSLRTQAGISDLLASLLVSRGIEHREQASLFLDPSLTRLQPPEDLPGCTETAWKLARAIAEKRRIVIYGDYDVDGITATAILREVLKTLGADVHYYVPSRLDEGYGLHNGAIKSLYEQGTKTIITVDCGISSIEQADFATSLGIELLITDHHHPGGELPKAAAIAHPQLAHVRGVEISLDHPVYRTVALIEEQTPEEDKYPFPGLCGAGVALKVAWALAQTVSGEQKVPPSLKNVLVRTVGLAALGTVADMVPLLDENRVIVHFGLRKPLMETPPVGLRELMGVAKIKNDKPLRGEDVAFQIAPRLNAAGRLGLATLGVELLTTNDSERAREIANLINGMNESRQKIERDVVKKANQKIKEQCDPNDPAFVLCDDDWHSGVIGIVAGRLASEHHRPVIMISQDKMGLKPGSGSCRSVPGVNVHDALQACNEYLLRFGGHAAAAGLGIRDSQIQAFRAAFCEYIDTHWPEDERLAELAIDGEFPLSAFTFQTLYEIERMAPFGADNPKPKFCTRGVTISPGSVKTLGAEGRHFTCHFKQFGHTMRAVTFNAAHWVDELAFFDNRPLDIAFTVKINDFAGRSSVEMELLDWKPGDE